MRASHCGELGLGDPRSPPLQGMRDGILPKALAGFQRVYQSLRYRIGGPVVVSEGGL